MLGRPRQAPSAFGQFDGGARAIAAAAAFGFGAIVALREGLRATLGVRLFARASPIVQGPLVILLGTPLMVLPAVFWNVGGWWLTGQGISPLLVPPLWFLGLHEVIAGQIIEGLPRGDMPGRIPGVEQAATTLYRVRGARAALGMALVALGIIVIVSAAAAIWNNRGRPRRCRRDAAGIR